MQIRSRILVLGHFAYGASLFKKILLIFNWRMIALQHCVGFCHTATCISHRYTRILPPEPPSHLPLHPAPPGCPSRLSQSAGVSSPHHTAGSRWLAVSHMVVHMFPCYSLNLSHPHTYGEGNGTPLQYSCLKNPMDGGAWWAAVHGVVKSRTRLSNFTFTFHFHVLEKEMATHSSVLAWRIPGTGEPGGLLSLGSHRVGHD